MTKEKLRKLQLVELEILNYFVNVCEINGLRYFLLGGTLLGAVRHKGFIPWDDDIDVGMPRKDYNKFLDIINNDLPKNYIFKNFNKNNESTIYFSRIENNDFAVIDNSAIKKRKRYAWIDVFPLDGMPNNIIKRNIHKISLLFLRLKFQYSNFSIIVNQSLNNRPLYERILIIIGKIIKPEKYLNSLKCLRQIDKKLQKYDYDKSDYVVNFMGAYKFKEMFKKELYSKIEYYQFENNYYVAPKEYNTILKQMYGNYMQIPKDRDKYKHCIEIE